MNAERGWMASAPILAIILPLVSAALLPRRNTDGYFKRYLRVAIIYLASFAFIFIGYFLQGVWDGIPLLGRFETGWKRIPMMLAYYPYIDRIPSVLLVSCISAFAILLTPRLDDIAGRSFRTLFVVLVIVDLMHGMMSGYSVAEYVECVVFDFVGALLFAAVIPIFVTRLWFVNESKGTSIQATD